MRCFWAKTSLDYNESCCQLDLSEMHRATVSHTQVSRRIPAGGSLVDGQGHSVPYSGGQNNCWQILGGTVSHTQVSGKIQWLYLLEICTLGLEEFLLAESLADAPGLSVPYTGEQKNSCWLELLQIDRATVSHTQVSRIIAGTFLTGHCVRYAGEQKITMAVPLGDMYTGPRRIPSGWISRRCPGPQCPIHR